MFGKIFVYLYFELVSTSSSCHKSFLMGHFASQKVSLPQLMLGPNLIFQHSSSLLPDQSTKVHPNRAFPCHQINPHHNTPIYANANDIKQNLWNRSAVKKRPQKYFLYFSCIFIFCVCSLKLAPPKVLATGPISSHDSLGHWFHVRAVCFPTRFWNGDFQTSRVRSTARGDKIPWLTFQGNWQIAGP